MDNASFHSCPAQLIQSVAARLDPCRRASLHSPTFLGNHQAAGHLVKKSTPMCKISLFGAGAKSHDRHSSVACDSRPGLLRVCTGFSGDARIANAPQGTPNRNILHIGMKKTTTCCRQAQVQAPNRKYAAIRHEKSETHVAPRVRLLTKGGVICQQGEEATGFFRRFFTFVTFPPGRQ